MIRKNYFIFSSESKHHKYKQYSLAIKAHQRYHTALNVKDREIRSGFINDKGHSRANVASPLIWTINGISINLSKCFQYQLTMTIICKIGKSTIILTNKAAFCPGLLILASELVSNNCRILTSIQQGPILHQSCPKRIFCKRFPKSLPKSNLNIRNFRIRSFFDTKPYKLLQ